MIITNEIESYIVLSEEQRKNVCEELARIIFEVKKQKNVECIYFTPCKNFGDIVGNVLEITIVTSGQFQNKDREKFDDYNALHLKEEMLKKYGVKIHVDFDFNRGYTPFPLNPSEIQCRYNLFNSTVLFDRTGEYVEIIKHMNQEDEMISYYSNLSQIEPPILDELRKVIEEKQMEEDSLYLRKSVQSELFQYFKDIK